jgi:hypothetical protein
MRPHFNALLLAFVVAAPAAADIVDSQTERQLSLPGAKFRIVIPREDWLITREQTRSDARSVYYALASQKRDMALWVFIDQTPVCQSSKACIELAMKNKAYDEAQDMTFFEHEGFDVVQFTLTPAKDGAKQQHLIAATYIDGSWVDIHLLQAAKSGSDAGTLAAVLKLLSIK